VPSRSSVIIVSIDGTPVATIENCLSVLEQASKKVEVIFINVENGQRESIILYPREGRIGLEGEPSSSINSVSIDQGATPGELLRPAFSFDVPPSMNPAPTRGPNDRATWPAVALLL